MRYLKFGLSALALLPTGLAVPASAAGSEDSPTKATPPTVIARPADKDAHTQSPPDFAAMAAFVDKLFPPQPDPDPARLALAQMSVRAMWPDGAYGNMMIGLLGGMFDRFMKVNASDLPGDGKRSRNSPSDAKADPSLHDKVVAKDPYFDQRMAAIREVVTEEMTKISAIVDPPMRSGLARAMARRFDVQQLAEINRFFATPTGVLFAGQYMQLWVDPDTMRSVFASAPQLMKLMPEIAGKLKAANDRFPKPPAAAPGSRKP